MKPRKHMRSVTVTAVIIAASGAAIWSFGHDTHSVGAARASTRATTPGDPLQTVTPYQLSQMGVTLGPAVATPPAISASQADQVAQHDSPFGSDPVLETVYATCKQPTGMEPCWVVSLQPTHPMPVIGGPICVGCGSPPEVDPSATVELVWVDPQTGQLTDAMDIDAPATAPSTN